MELVKIEVALLGLVFDEDHQAFFLSTCSAKLQTKVGILSYGQVVLDLASNPITRLSFTRGFNFFLWPRLEEPCLARL